MPFYPPPNSAKRFDSLTPSKDEGVPTMTTRMSRRGFLAASAGTVGAVAAAPLLAACGHPGGNNAGSTSAKSLSEILPAYVPGNAVKADIPSVNGSDPGFISYPANPVKTVTEVPGA